MKQGGLKELADKNIGQGASGTAVIKAYEIEGVDPFPNIEGNVGKKVCFVKKIFSKTTNNDDDIKRKNFRNEIDMMFKLNHRNIITFYSYGSDGAVDFRGRKIPGYVHDYYIMDYFNGGDLKKAIKSKQISVDIDCYQGEDIDPYMEQIEELIFGDRSREEMEGHGLEVHKGGGVKVFPLEVNKNVDGTPNTHTIILEIFNGLKYLHGKSIIHCDIKPENILINVKNPESAPALRVVICDFGESYEAIDIDLEGDAPGTAGTLLYLPIEVIRLNRKLLSQDYYAFGVVILKLLLLEDAHNEKVARLVTARRFGLALLELHRFYLKIIEDNEHALNGELVGFLKNLLYIPGEEEDYPSILQKRRGAFEEIGQFLCRQGDTERVACRSDASEGRAGAASGPTRVELASAARERARVQAKERAAPRGAASGPTRSELAAAARERVALAALVAAGAPAPVGYDV